jgi:hypothetical protein
MFSREQVLSMLQNMQESAQEKPRKSDWSSGYHEGLAKAFAIAIEWVGQIPETNHQERGAA